MKKGTVSFHLEIYEYKILSKFLLIKYIFQFVIFAFFRSQNFNILLSSTLELNFFQNQNLLLDAKGILICLENCNRFLFKDILVIIFVYFKVIIRYVTDLFF
jgi:hypothetical protein